ncbi:CarD family transcriptional regulator [Clostridium boliviensis]|uniref:CarD family transcriptional regulator n=1 Tax=Clostridium boliviensis TaxID=318465 RepID=A0ABU4GIL3_9CLOT|nr:CarD family transcriptional regulator [Clostridium boliviensis]MDW2797451.1 CarD family transcriptional regulator [Clostridium boliviensis]
MFQVNDLVVFGSHGICEVKEIGNLCMFAADDERTYYTLKPLYEDHQSAVYTPVDNLKTTIRPAATREEAMNLIDHIPSIETIWAMDEREREGIFKDIMLKCECTGWMQIVKTLYLKKKKRLAEGKKNTAKDDFYFNKAEDLLYGELAAALEVDKEGIKDMVISRVYSEEVN